MCRGVGAHTRYDPGCCEADKASSGCSLLSYTAPWCYNPAAPTTSDVVYIK